MKCAVCGKEFDAPRKNAVCCSDKCKRERNNFLCKKWLINNYEVKGYGTATCPICGNEFTKKASNQKYCCSECLKKSRNAKKLDRYYKKRGKVKPPREKATYGGARPVTPALESFFERFAELLKQVRK